MFFKREYGAINEKYYHQAASAQVNNEVKLSRRARRVEKKFVFQLSLKVQTAL
mgnify:CR=1 FL=1